MCFFFPDSKVAPSLRAPSEEGARKEKAEDTHARKTAEGCFTSFVRKQRKKCCLLPPFFLSFRLQFSSSYGFANSQNFLARTFKTAFSSRILFIAHNIQRLRENSASPALSENETRFWTISYIVAFINHFLKSHIVARQNRFLQRFTHIVLFKNSTVNQYSKIRKKRISDFDSDTAKN